jgi:hypothetical protein
MENKTKIRNNVEITINNRKHNILHHINQTEKDITPLSVTNLIHALTLEKNMLFIV